MRNYILTLFTLINAVTSNTSKLSSPLLILTPNIPTNSSETCKGPEIVSCKAALVNWDSISTKADIILPTGELLNFSHELESAVENSIMKKHAKSRVYIDDLGSHAVITFDWVGSHMYGLVDMADGNGYKIELMEDLQHVVWAKLDLSVFAEREEKVEESELDLNIDRTTLSHMRMDDLLAQGRTDKHTLVNLTITVYYTADFRELVFDPKTFIDQVIAETNQGYINSQIPLRLILHCVIQSDIQDGLPATETLQKFTSYRSNSNALRMSADATILLVTKYSEKGVCGVNWFNKVDSGSTIGTVTKSCALGYYSFGHELAHGLGLAHDRRVVKESSTPYAFGNVIKRGSYRSIMAYSTAGEKRINYYSSPLAKYKDLPTGTPENDNARRLTEVRFAAANIGDESMKCPSSSTSSSASSSFSSSPSGWYSIQKPTQAPVPACSDYFKNCPQLAETNCWNENIKEDCPYSCGLCYGQIPSKSNTCYNKFSNCEQLAMLGYCSHDSVRAGCNKSCGCA